MVTIQQKLDTTPPTWPSERVPMQMHMDFKVPSADELAAIAAGPRSSAPTLLHDRSADDGEPLFVMRDPAGHPFCLLVQ